MNMSNAPKTAPRITPAYNVRWGIKAYDTDNLYPQWLLNVVGNSSTLSGCLGRYIDFIEGKGLSDTNFAAWVVNRRGETMNDIHHLCAIDKGTFDGFAIHINYDILCRPCEIFHVPFQDCRLEEPDDSGYVSKVYVHPDWMGRLTRSGKRYTVDESKIDKIDVFNPDPDTIRRQMIKAGGIEQYLGQILYVSGAGHMVYPVPRYDSVLCEALTDEGLSNVKLRNVRNNFLAAGILTRLKNRHAGLPANPEDPNAENPEEEDDFEEQLATLQGDTNALKILSFTADYEEEVPKWTPLTIQNFDKAFTATEDSVKDKIYSIFQQEGWLCIRNGKVGFGGQLLNDVKTEYSERTEKERLSLTMAYHKVLENFAPELLPEQPTLENLRIEPIITPQQPTDDGNTNDTDNPE